MKTLKFLVASLAIFMFVRPLAQKISPLQRKFG